MKIIFLDIDGVLNCEYSKSRCDGFIGIDMTKLRLLKQIVDATGAKIVLSSTWRIGYDRLGHELQHHAKYMNRKFQKAGLIIYDVTPYKKHRRSEEIEEWLEDKDVESFVILDDEDFEWSPELRKRWIKSSFYEANGGIRQEHVDRAIELLNS